MGLQQTQQQPGGIAAQASMNAFEALQKASVAQQQSALAQGLLYTTASAAVNGNNSMANPISSTHITAAGGLLNAPATTVVSGAGNSTVALLPQPQQSAQQSSLVSAMIAARASGAPLLAQAAQSQAALQAGVVAAQQQQLMAAAQAQAAAIGNPLTAGSTNHLALAALQAQQNHPLLQQNAQLQIAQMNQIQQAAAAQAAAQQAAAGQGPGNTIAAVTPQGLVFLPRH